MADALGYLGVVAGMLYKNFGHGEDLMLGFFATLSYFVAILMVAALVGSWIYFSRRTSRD